MTASPLIEPGTADMTSLRQALAEGRTTPAEEVEAAIRRVEAANPQLNFMVWSTFERARAQAEARAAGPLAGVPTLIKDHLPEKGVPMSFGSAALKDYVATDDAPYARAMADAGLISLARTTMPELGLNAVTESPLSGPTRNPWNPDHTPGGSSGGAAAAVAAGVVPVAHASDGLGSIRHGAAPCGLVGLKPSRGRNVGDEAMRAISDLGVHGCVSRTVRDTAAWLDATQSRAAGAAFAPVQAVAGPIERPLRIHAYSAIMRTGEAPHPAVGRVFAQTIDLLGRLRHRVVDASLPFDGPAAIATLVDITEGMFGRRLAMLSQAIGRPIARQDLEHRSLTLLAAGELIDDARFDQAWRKMQTFVDAYLSRLDEIDIWVTPTLGQPAPRIGVLGPDVAWLAQRDQLVDYAGYCWIDNLAGTPAISLPMGFDDDGVPVGVQFATRPGDEALLLALAYQLEAAVEWWRHRPPIWVGEDD